MDGHAVPDEGYVGACLRVLDATGAWNVGGQMRKVGLGRSGRAASAAASSPFGIGGGDRFHLLETAQDVDSVWLGCWPRWAFERVGIFDPTMVGAEDEELNQRIVDAGGRIRFDPSISAAYISRSTWHSLARQYFRYGMAKVRVVQSRPSVFRIRHLAPAAMLAAIVGGLVLAVVSPIGLGFAGLVVLAWLAAAVVFAHRVASRFESSTADVIAAFGCLHFGYGIGTWFGLIRFAPRWFIGRRTTAPRLDGSSL
jgi:hypothetical protein